MPGSKGIVLAIEAANIRVGGGVTHLAEILSALRPEDHNLRKVYLFCSRRVAHRFPSRSWLDIVTPSALEGSLPRRLLWLNSSLDDFARRHADVLFVPGGTFLGRFRPFVVACQNLLPFDHAERRRFGWTRDRARLHALEQTQRATFRRAEAILFPSRVALEVTEGAIGSLANRAFVVPHGAPAGGPSTGREKDKNGHLNALYVSNVDVYKHQWHVVEAVRALRARGVAITLHLVGPAGTPEGARRLDASLKRIDQAGTFVIRHGVVDHGRLHEFYGAADLFVYASTCETFGMVLVEAMAEGVPLACSNRSACPEVAGDAAVYFDPEKPREIEEAMWRLVQDPALREQLVEKGFQRLREFSWDVCARQTFTLVAKAARSNRSEKT